MTLTPVPDRIIAYAKTGHDKTGLPVGVILAQWILETGGFTSDLFISAHNFAGIKYHGAYAGRNGFSAYPDENSGFNDWVRTIMLGYYDSVRAVASSLGGAQAVIKALGESPWDAGHYNNGAGAGTSLLALYKADQLDAFDVMPDTHGMTGIVSQVVGTEIKLLGDTTKYYIKPEYAGMNLVKISDTNNHILGRTDILAGFLGIDQNWQIPAGFSLTLAKFPTTYVPDSTEYKGFFQVFTTLAPVGTSDNSTGQVVSPIVNDQPAPVKTSQQLIIALVIKWLDNAITWLRKFVPLDPLA